MAEITRTVTSNLYFNGACEVFTQAITPYYGSYVGAENYVASLLSHRRRDWNFATKDDRIASLREATRLIEALNFRGTKLVSGQILHFPTSEDGLPNGIAIACYEIALQLIGGVDIETEARNLSVTSQGFASGRTTFDRSFVQEHIRANVPSAYAWSILRPYLCDPLGLQLSKGG